MASSTRNPLYLFCWQIQDSFKDFFRRHDPDDIFAYKTVKIVRIRDRRLGLLHYSFLLGIILYIVVFTVILGKRYLLVQSPLGSVRMGLLAPLTRPAAEELPYCLAHDETYRGFANLPCYYWDANDVVFPVTEQTAMFATTRVAESYETRIGESWTLNTTRFERENSTEFVFIAQPEMFTIRIDHTFNTPALGLQRNGKAIDGSIHFRDGREFSGTDGANTVGVGGKFDDMELGLLLEAAGIDLDTLAPENADDNESKRFAGVVLLVFISYDNTFSYSLSEVRYVYNVFEVDNTEFKGIQTISSAFDPTTHQPTGRVIRNRHGIRLIFIQEGTLGKFDFQTLLIQLVSGLGLLAVSTLIVDTLAIMVMPQKDYYTRYKYTNTLDFSDVRDGLVVVPESLDRPALPEGDQQGLPSGDDRAVPLLNMKHEE